MMVAEAALNSVARALYIEVTNEASTLVAEVVGETTVEAVPQVVPMSEARCELFSLRNFDSMYLYLSISSFRLSATGKNG